MKGSKFILMLLGVAIMSCYFFPFVLAYFPMANSKMILAVVGLAFLGTALFKRQDGIVDGYFMDLTLGACAVSLVAFLSMTINNTPDNTFATYFMSMWVWLGGAYAAICYIKWVHGGVSVPLVINYLLVVCVIQCVLALLFDRFPEMETWHFRTFAGDAYMGNTNEKRMHGIGCSLDVAGFRFSTVIVMVCYLMYLQSKRNKTSTIINAVYFAAITFITIVGNMISRSTIIGTGVGITFICIISVFVQGNRKLLGQLSVIALIAIAISTYLYNTNLAFHNNLRFGFEGFFSLAETGEWQTNSNNILKNMVVWPESLKTWIIGDGYINNPANKSLSTFDPYYVGSDFGGYYKGTDIGYLRYIFYFGMTGLVVFSVYFIRCCVGCMRRFEMFKWMFILILMINFIQWFKVSTDLFLVFALFLCVSKVENETYMSREEKKSPQ